MKARHEIIMQNQLAIRDLQRQFTKLLDSTVEMSEEIALIMKRQRR